jgi:signal transduction histidine kinase
MGRPRVRLPAGAAGDVALAAAGAGVTAVALGANLGGPGGRALDAAGWLLPAVIGALLLVRRRWPVPVLLASVAVLLGYYALGYPPVGLALPLAGAFFSAAEAGRLRWAVGTAVGVLAVSYGYRVGVGQDLGLLFGYDFGQTVVLLAGTIAAGDAVRSRRRERAHAAERAATEAARRGEDARRAMERERARVARDVHDVLAHTVTVISLQADVAVEALPGDPAAAAAALGHVRTASREAGRELRASLDLLRGSWSADRTAGGGSDRQPVGSLRDLPRLADRARAGGLPVTIEVLGAGSLPTTVDSTAYRIVQEALTNVLRHAGADSARVVLRYLPDRIDLQVSDDGRGCAAVPPGHGLTGMRERASLLGGTLVAGPLAPHGFRVHASLPVELVP